MRHKTALAAILAAVLLTVGGYLFFTLPIDRPHGTAEPGFRIDGTVMELREAGTWKKFTPRGVNLGTGYPGVFPNEYGIDRETYSRWFTQIGAMNANVIRVYQTQSPAFYTALLDYNRHHENKLYLLQGVDFPEPLQYSEKNLLEEPVHRALFRDTRQLIRFLHGDGLRLDWKTGDLHCYTADVSPYVLGYLPGIEWDKIMVEYVCRRNEDLPPWEGQYLQCTEDANGFEHFLARWGEALLSYEMETYGVQKLLSFCNWPDTDPMTNELQLTPVVGTERSFGEAKVDVEHIRCTDAVTGGLFASYNVYPYFPTFLQYGPYTRLRDPAGSRNPYYGYLKALADYHTCPVVITEYGVPASRTLSYADIWLGASHGGLTEQAQAEKLPQLLHWISASGCAGSVAFSWQDEWYKTVWSETLLSDPDARAAWPNAQCAEQFFGLLAFEPGETGTTPYPDGDLSDWQDISPTAQTDKLSVSCQWDEKYVYFLVSGTDGTLPMPFRLAIDTLPDFGSTRIGGTALERAADFVLHMEDPETAKLFVHRDYQLLPYSAFGGYHDSSLTSLLKLEEEYQVDDLLPGSPDFEMVCRASGDIYHSMQTRWVVEKAGVLRPGNANPDSPDYNSNGDFCLADGAVELRIPWQLLNFTAPSLCTVAAAPGKEGGSLQSQTIDEFYLAVCEDGSTEASGFGACQLRGWDRPAFHERLKPAYYALQQAFKEATP